MSCTRVCDDRRCTRKSTSVPSAKRPRHFSRKLEKMILYVGLSAASFGFNTNSPDFARRRTFYLVNTVQYTTLSYLRIEMFHADVDYRWHSIVLCCSKRTIGKWTYSGFSCLLAKTELYLSSFTEYTGGQSVTVVLLCSLPICIDLFMIDDIFVLFSENTNDDDEWCVKWCVPPEEGLRQGETWRTCASGVESLWSVECLLAAERAVSYTGD